MLRGYDGERMKKLEKKEDKLEKEKEMKMGYFFLSQAVTQPTKL